MYFSSSFEASQSLYGVKMCIVILIRNLASENGLMADDVAEASAVQPAGIKTQS